MIHQAKVYDAQGNLKEVVPGHELSRRFWANALSAPMADAEKLAGGRSLGGKVAARNRGVSEQTKGVLWRMICFMRSHKPPKGRVGFSISEILAGIGITPQDNYYRQASHILNSAHKPAFGGYNVCRQRRPGRQRRYQYFLKEGK